MYSVFGRYLVKFLPLYLIANWEDRFYIKFFFFVSIFHMKYVHRNEYSIVAVIYILPVRLNSKPISDFLVC